MQTPGGFLIQVRVRFAAGHLVAADHVAEAAAAVEVAAEVDPARSRYSALRRSRPITQDSPNSKLINRSG